MSKKIFYAVPVGREVGVYETWGEAEAQCSGFPGGKSKKFLTREEAQEYLDSYTDEILTEEADYEVLVNNALKSDRVVAFTDGSYSGKTEESGYGIYIMHENIKPIEISDKVYAKKFKSTNNTAPEIFAILEALKWVVANEYEKVTIFTDFELAVNWANGTFKTNSELGKLFVRELDEKYRMIIDIELIWIKGHVGHEYNEKADKLAKNAIKDRKPVGKYGANSFYGTGVEEVKVMEILHCFEKQEEIITNSSRVQGGRKYRFSRGNDKLTVTFFERKEAVWLQGEVKGLFSEFLSLYTQNISMFDMVRAYSDSYKETIKAKDVENFIMAFNFPDDYPETAIKLLQQAYLMRELNRREIDYSHYTTPAYRALEGHLKYLCKLAGVNANRKTLGGYFENYTDKDGNTVKVLSNKILKQHQLASRIEDVYNLLFLKRHPLSHFGDILINGFEDTMLIEDIQEAHSRIDEVFNLIKNTLV